MIERLLRFACSRPRVVLLAAASVLAVSILLVVRVSFDPNIVRLLPRNGLALGVFDDYLQQFGTFGHASCLIAPLLVLPALLKENNRS